MIGSVPFVLFGRYWSHSSAQGILRLERDDLVLDLSESNPWTWKQSPPHEIRIPLRQVDALEYKNNWFLFHVWLRLRVRKLEYFVGVPNSDGAEVVLWCKRLYKSHAQDLANAVTLRLLERVFIEDEIPERQAISGDEAPCSDR
jgi:hypothetical protein